MQIQIAFLLQPQPPLSSIATVKLTEGDQRHAVLRGRDFSRRFRPNYDRCSGSTIFEDESPFLAVDRQTNS